VADETSKIDSNQKHCLMGVTNAATPELRNIKVAAATSRLLVSATVSGITTITVANEATDTTCFPLFTTAATGDLGPKTNAGLTFNSNTGSLGATLMTTRKISLGSAGVATGSIEINGTTSGTVTLKTADAAGTYTLTLPTTDGDANQLLKTDGSGNLSWADAGGGVPTAITVADEATDTTCFVAFFTAATGDLGPKSNAGLTFNSNTGNLGATLFNGLTLTSAATGFTIAGGTTSKTLTVALDASVSGTNTGDGTYGIANTNYVKIDAADVADNDYAKFTANGLEGRSYSEVLSDISAAPTASPTFTGTITISDNCRIDLTLPTADGYATGPTTDSFNAGYSSTAIGDLVYLDSSSTWQKVDADAIATSGGLLGVALEVKASGNAVKVALFGSMVRVDSWNWTAGATLYASETPGGIATAIPTGANGVVRVIGWAINADAIMFMPSSDNSTVVA
jgi:hypothetical protein